MKQSRKPDPAEFKQEAVRLLKEQRLPSSQVARDLGMDAETLRRWARELSPDNAGARETPTAPPVSSAELARLRREHEQLRMERDILKKPSASSRLCPNEPHVPSSRVAAFDRTVSHIRKGDHLITFECMSTLFAQDRFLCETV